MVVKIALPFYVKDTFIFSFIYDTIKIKNPGEDSNEGSNYIRPRRNGDP